MLQLYNACVITLAPLLSTFQVPLNLCLKVVLNISRTRAQNSDEVESVSRRLSTVPPVHLGIVRETRVSFKNCAF